MEVKQNDDYYHPSYISEKTQHTQKGFWKRGVRQIYTRFSWIAIIIRRSQNRRSPSPFLCALSSASAPERLPYLGYHARHGYPPRPVELSYLTASHQACKNVRSGSTHHLILSRITTKIFVSIFDLPSIRTSSRASSSGLVESNGN